MEPVAIKAPPLAALGQVWHVGSLDPAEKGSNSMEGHGLSFSMNPEEWAEIAELGDDDPWEADIGQCKIVDAHALDAQSRAQIRQWALDHGLMVEREAWKVKWFDDECDVEMYTLCASQEEAFRESQEYGDESKVTQVTGYTPTALLCERMHWHDVSGRICESTEEAALIAWCEDAGWDGVWWEDELDLGRLSAPRGVLFPRAFASVEWDRAGESAYAQTGDPTECALAAPARRSDGMTF